MPLTRSKSMKRKNVGELALLDRIRNRAPQSSRDLRLGIGDDCALLRPAAGEELAVTTDLSIAGRHFRLEDHSPGSRRPPHSGPGPERPRRDGRASHSCLSFVRFTARIGDHETRAHLGRSLSRWLFRAGRPHQNPSRRGRFSGVASRQWQISCLSVPSLAAAPCCVPALAPATCFM